MAGNWEPQTETKGKEGLHEGVECAVEGGGGWEKEQRAALAALHRSIRLYYPGAPTPSVAGYRFPVFSRSRKLIEIILQDTDEICGLSLFTRDVACGNNRRL